MERCSEIFVGIDVSKTHNAVAVADGERGGEVRCIGVVDAAPESRRRLVKRLAAKHPRVQFCYEAGQPATACIASSPTLAIPGL